MSSSEDSSASAKEKQTGKDASSSEGAEEESEALFQCDMCQSVIETDAVRFRCEECEVRPLHIHRLIIRTTMCAVIAILPLRAVRYTSIP